MYDLIGKHLLLKRRIEPTISFQQRNMSTYSKWMDCDARNASYAYVWVYSKSSYTLYSYLLLQNLGYDVKHGMRRLYIES